MDKVGKSKLACTINQDCVSSSQPRGAPCSTLPVASWRWPPRTNRTLFFALHAGRDLESKAEAIEVPRWWRHWGPGKGGDQVPPAPAGLGLRSGLGATCLTWGCDVTGKALGRVGTWHVR
jgi:hypothetical protein